VPTYEYECTACPHTFEKFQSITARPLRKCPKCGGTVRRLIGAGAGVIFKGSGFYETDYKRKRSGSGEEKPDKKQEKKSEGSDSSSGEAKSASKTPDKSDKSKGS
jgi:putative FmdB family regulatory protein